MDITFKIKRNNEIWQDIDENGNFTGEIFCCDVEEKTINGKKINWVQVRLDYPNDDPSGDPQKRKGMVDIPNYEKLGNATSRGKEFKLISFKEELLNTDCHELDHNGEGELNLGRSAFYNIDFDNTALDVYKDNWGDIELIDISSLNPKAGNTDFTEINDKIKEFNQALVNSLWLNRYVSFDVALHSFGKYGMLSKQADNIVDKELGKFPTIDKYFLENFENKKAAEVMTHAQRMASYPHEAGWFDIVNPNSNYKKHIKSRKDDFKKRHDQVKDAIAAAKEIVPRLEKMIDTWRKGGGLVDSDYNLKLEEFNKTKDDIANRFNKLKEKIEKEEKNKDLRPDWTTEIGKKLRGFSASDDLETAPSPIGTDQINKYHQDTAQNEKEDKKKKLRKLLSILTRKKAVVEKFETKVANGGGGGSKHKCPQCNNEFDALPISHNGTNYCSDKCKNEANKDGGGNKYNCAKCGKENTDTPTIKDGKKYCSVCSKEEPKNNDEKNKDKNPSQSKTKAIQEINTALGQDPKVLTSDLDSDYRNWENQIKQLNEAEKINSLKDLVLKNIDKIRKEKKSSAKIDSDLEALKIKKGEDLKKSLKDMINENDGKKHWEDKKSSLAEEEDRLFQEDPEKLKDLVKEVVESKMTKCGVSEGELGTEEKKIFTDLKTKKISDKKQLQEGKRKLIKFVGNKEIEKKVKDFKKQVERASNSSEKNSIRNKLLSLLAEDNIYVDNYKNEIKQLFEKLEKSASDNTTKNPSSDIPWKIVLPIALVVVVGIVGLVLWKRKKRADLE